jgi:hypothetical protein
LRKALEPGAEIVERDGRLSLEPRGQMFVDVRSLLRGEWDEESVEDLVAGEFLGGMRFDEAPPSTTG